jgi:hypothetical protein
MIRPLLILAMFLPLSAQSVTIAWDPSLSPDVAGYTLRWGTNSGIYPRSTNVLNVTNFTLANSNLFPGTNFMAVTAYSMNGLSSDPSNEISFTVPAAPKNFRLALESAPAPDGPWQEVASAGFTDAGEVSRFYRGQVYSGP